MSVKPILFTQKWYRQYDDRKTQTRRVIKPQPVKEGVFWRLGGAGWGMDDRVTPVYGHSLYNVCHTSRCVLWVEKHGVKLAIVLSTGSLVQTAVFHKYKTDL